MDERARWAFLALILAQAAHSVEEYTFRLFDVFAPARLVSGLLSNDLATGFATLNVGIVLLGLWSYAARVRPGHPAAHAVAWFWTLLECGNGLGHTGIAVAQGGYFPGVATAPLLVGASSYLGARLWLSRRRIAIR